MAACRPYWLAYRAQLAAQYAPAGNTGTVYYLDPNSATNGVGTFADPFNAVPAVATYRGNTVLIAEGTTLAGQFTTGGAFSYNLGTYSRMDGSRLYDMTRAATINASSFTTGVSFSGAGSNPVVVSGLRITGARNAAGVAYGVYAGNNAAGGSLIVEHCVIDDCSGSAISTLLSARAEQMILRFNRLVGTNVDMLFLQSSTSAGIAEVYGNEIIVGSNATLDGPDAIQLSRTSGGVFRRVRVFGNWIEHNANTKQGFIISGNTPAAGGEEIHVYRNFFFGMQDPDSLTDLSGNGSSQVAISVDIAGPMVWSNYIDGWRLWASVKGDTAARGLFAYNICVTDMPEYSSATSAMIGGSATSDYMVVAHNTFITTGNIGSSTPTDVPVVRFGGTNNVIKNNAFCGAWRHAIRFNNGAGSAESANLFYGITDRKIVSNSGGSEIAIAGTSITTDPLFDVVGRPAFGSPVVAAAEAVSNWDGTALILPDPFGRLAGDISEQWIGAAQSYSQ